MIGPMSSPSSSVAQPTNPDNIGPGSTAFDGSVAVAVGLYTNTAKSYIDTGASAVDKPEPIYPSRYRSG